LQLTDGIAGYRTSSACLAAQNFTMPALSPTMTEGNIASWKVKEGDSFSAGDVLLEIETDKATMDVEAQDDGIVAKIFMGDGSKAVQVGSRIGVLAESGDDLSTLQIPEDNGAPDASPKKEPAKSDAAKTPVTSHPDIPASADKPATKREKHGKAKAQTYPLLPSVEILIHQNGLDKSAIEKMTPTGPNNRLLKGDVLAYLGSISESYPEELSAKLEKLTHLDLSNIKIITPAAPPPKAVEVEIPAAPVAEPIAQVAVPVSMAAVFEVQERIEKTLGVFMPLSTFIARAADFANDSLPRSKTAKPTADELFNSVLGLDNVSSAGVRGNFTPQITALPETAIATMPRRPVPSSKSDVIDILAGKRSLVKSIYAGVPGVAATTNIFSVSVPKGDEKRAKVFLERVKIVLEAEPGRLVL